MNFKKVIVPNLLPKVKKQRKAKKARKSRKSKKVKRQTKRRVSIKTGKSKWIHL